MIRALFANARWPLAAAGLIAVVAGGVVAAGAADEPDLIFRKTTVFKLLT